MVKEKIDDIEFKLREHQDFNWLTKYGKIFSVIDETGSGCILFGIQKSNQKYFFKIAGAKTVESEVSEQDSIKLLKEAVKKYQEIKHDNLIQYITSFDYQDFFVVIYKYAEGETLFDHWNFSKYKNNSKMEIPGQKFKKLSIEKRLNVIYKLFSFFETVIATGYLAVDFYDSSIIYNFNTDEVIFCDIDLFRKAPTKNNLGENYYGTRRFKAPEENILNEIIDEKTNEFTLGAIIFDMFSEVKNNEDRYKKGTFIPNNLEDFELSKEVYNVLIKATSNNREERYKTIKEFEQEFRKATKK